VTLMKRGKTMKTLYDFYRNGGGQRILQKTTVDCIVISEKEYMSLVNISKNDSLNVKAEDIWNKHKGGFDDEGLI